MNVLFIPCIIDGAASTSASVRFRARWPAKYWHEADVYQDCSHHLSDYDAYIFQKAYLGQRAREMISSLEARGKILALDMCDADWTQSTEHERRLLQVLPLFDFAVSPTEALQAWLARWVPAYVIPDRLDLEVVFEHKYRCGHKPPSAVWFGYSHNLIELDQVWSEMVQVLDKHNLPLAVVSDALPVVWQDRTWGKGRKIRFVTWTPEIADVAIGSNTIALVPSSNPYKSNNRTITAWALGLQTAESAAQLETQLAWDWKVRESYLEQRQAEIKNSYDVRLSVEEWKAHLEQHQVRKQAAVQHLACVHKGKGGQTE